jgi:hypothetical protein
MTISFYYLIGGVRFLVKRPSLGCAQKPRKYRPPDSVGVEFPPLYKSVKFALLWCYVGICGDSKNNRENVDHLPFDFDFRETGTVCVKHDIRKQDPSGVCTPECAPCAPCAHPDASALECVLRFRCRFLSSTF